MSRSRSPTTWTRCFAWPVTPGDSHLFRISSEIYRSRMTKSRLRNRAFTARRSFAITECTEGYSSKSMIIWMRCWSRLLVNKVPRIAKACTWRSAKSKMVWSASAALLSTDWRKEAMSFVYLAPKACILVMSSNLTKKSPYSDSYLKRSTTPTWLMLSSLTGA